MIWSCHGVSHYGLNAIIVDICPTLPLPDFGGDVSCFNSEGHSVAEGEF